jgi:pSer/pThr/pTyr-binding forkhead associated (FHA) protein
MKLVFSNNEHPQLLLGAGANRIGSAPDGAAVLAADGMPALAYEVVLGGSGVQLRVPAGGAVEVNGRPVQGVIALRDGDRIGAAGVEAKLVAMEAARGVAADADGEDDDGATRVRTALPRFVLRGVSGPVFGKVFPLVAPTVVGRAPECDITINADEISRRHVQLRPMADSVAVEDLGSSNGTFVDGKRVQQGFLAPGAELRLDTVRFVLVAPGTELSGLRPAIEEPVERGSGLAWLGVAIVVAVLAAAAWFGLGGG